MVWCVLGPVWDGLSPGKLTPGAGSLKEGSQRRWRGNSYSGPLASCLLGSHVSRQGCCEPGVMPHACEGRAPPPAGGSAAASALELALGSLSRPLCASLEVPCSPGEGWVGLGDKGGSRASLMGHCAPVHPAPQRGCSRHSLARYSEGAFPDHPQSLWGGACVTVEHRGSPQGCGLLFPGLCFRPLSLCPWNSLWVALSLHFVPHHVPSPVLAVLSLQPGSGSPLGSRCPLRVAISA